MCLFGHMGHVHFLWFSVAGWEGVLSVLNVVRVHVRAQLCNCGCGCEGTHMHTHFSSACASPGAGGAFAYT